MKTEKFSSWLQRKSGRAAILCVHGRWLSMSVKELYLMNEPEIGISYHALPPITRNECGWYCTLLWWCAPCSLSPSFLTVGTVSFSLLFNLPFFGCTQRERVRERERAWARYRIENCEQIIFFAPFIIFYQAYLFWNISVRFCNIYAIYFLLFIQFDWMEAKKSNWMHQRWVTTMWSVFFTRYCECVCVLTPFKLIEVLHVDKWEKFKIQT